MTIDALLRTRMFRGNQSELARALDVTRNTIKKYHGDIKGKHHFVKLTGDIYELFTNQTDKV